MKPAARLRQTDTLVTWRMWLFLQPIWHVIYRPIKTRACRAMTHSRIGWHQVFAAKLGPKQEPGLVVRWPFWSHHKLPVHKRPRQWGCCFTTSPPPVSQCVHIPPPSHTYTPTGQFSLCSVSSVPVNSRALFESGVQTGVIGVSVCGSRGLSRSLRLLTRPTRVWPPPFICFFFVSGVFSISLC